MLDKGKKISREVRVIYRMLRNAIKYSYEDMRRVSMAARELKIKRSGKKPDSWKVFLESSGLE